ncbi:DUF6404 family protein [Psychromonas aquimarina]|uniref:DUF6404 family protein n=1 Tax=Psychromonas aquimarina TaxID=444919 RepID=UPI0006848024|nr:DUF6404 family protein [Psychromonas aquimarina]
MVTFERRLQLAHEELQQSGIWKSNYKPVPLTLIRRMGIQIKPPHYRKFLVNFLSYAVIVATAWGSLMWLLVWRSVQLEFYSVFVISACVGLLFGFTMAIYYRFSAQYHHLSNWQDFK